VEQIGALLVWRRGARTTWRRRLPPLQPRATGAAASRAGAMVKKTDKDMTDQELGMMYQKAAHFTLDFTRIYIYKWVLTNPSPNNAHLRC
jgi:hypothetical protein